MLDKNSEKPSFMKFPSSLGAPFIFTWHEIKAQEEHGTYLLCKPVVFATVNFLNISWAGSRQLFLKDWEDEIVGATLPVLHMYFFLIFLFAFGQRGFKNTSNNCIEDDSGMNTHNIPMYTMKIMLMSHHL